jgi:hypothetical protein
MTLLLAALVFLAICAAAFGAICAVQRQTIALMKQQTAELQKRNDVLLATALDANNVVRVDPQERAANRAEWVARAQGKKKRVAERLRELEREHATRPAEAGEAK